MISLTRLNGKEFVLNALFIESVEATPDTVISLTNGKKVMVQESVSQVTQLTTEFLAEIHVPGILQSELKGGR